MKLATLKRGGRDGSLVVVNRALTHCRPVPAIARTLQAALDDWTAAEAPLRQVYDALNSGDLAGAEPFDATACQPPCPGPTSGPTARPMSTMWSWCDGRAAPSCRPTSGPTR